MNRLPDDPVRLKDQHDQLKLVERIAGQAARDLADRAQLASTTMARMADRVATAQMRPARTSESLRFGWVLVMGAFLLGIVTAASAAHLDWLPRWITRNVPEKPKLVSHLAPGAAKARSFTRKDPPILPATAATPDASAPATGPLWESAPATVPVAKPPARRRLGVEAREPPAVAMRDAEPGTIPVAHGHSIPPVAWPTAPSPLLAEGAIWPLAAAPPPSGERRPTVQQAGPIPALRHPALPSLPATDASMHLKEIVRALRIDHSPSQALTLLDRHASELASNSFAEESLLLRVEAMLALGKRDSVLRLLDQTPLTDVASSRGLLITRGELRAAANRCAEGIGDFDLVLTDARRPPKKALLGRALCKRKLGDTAGASADLDRFRREFPGDPLP